MTRRTFYLKTKGKQGAKSPSPQNAGLEKGCRARWERSQFLGPDFLHEVFQGGGEGGAAFGTEKQSRRHQYPTKKPCPRKHRAALEEVELGEKKRSTGSNHPKLDVTQLFVLLPRKFPKKKLLGGGETGAPPKGGLLQDELFFLQPKENGEREL